MMFQCPKKLAADLIDYLKRPNKIQYANEPDTVGANVVNGNGAHHLRCTDARP